MEVGEFKRLLRQMGEELYRDMPWRDDTRPYYVLVSEIMLQQTQVSRAMVKFVEFIERFPDVSALAAASLGDVLRLWQGLGYNRRAKYLHDAAKMIVREFDGQFPTSQSDLLRLPGVGKNTAGAIMAYSFNQPAIFVETNIRTVYIHHFFADDFAVTDKQIIEKILDTVPWSDKGKEQPDRFSHKSDGAMRKTVGLSQTPDGPRRFYQNLMDYGSWLKASGVKNINQSRHYVKQSRLRGSLREVRGMIVRQLTKGELSETELYKRLPSDDRVQRALAGLERDGLIVQASGRYHLTK